MSIRGRGPVGSAARTAMVLSRFGPTASAMARRLDRYAAIASDFGIQPTWPTTACVLARHPDLVRRLAERGAEIAVHGLVHGDHKALDRDAQWDAIGRAVDIFERDGIRPTGFRGPYLRYNAATLEVLRALGLRYHSSQAVAFPLRDSDPDPGRVQSYELALDLYSARDANRVSVIPRLQDGLVDIPVAVPDDEILVERLRFDEGARISQWLHMLDVTYDRGALFPLQLHPERIDELGEALRATLAEARRRRPSVFMARLDEIASWWLRRSAFVLDVGRSDDRRYRVRLLSRRSPPAVRGFLTEEGFPVEVSDDREAYGAYVDADCDRWSEVDVLQAIDQGPGPLARIWRWPEGARSALAVTGDIDALTLRDFVTRSWETRGYRMGGGIDHEPTII
ncbi:MAG: hypothetical protein AUI15_41505 [Actinobacteria bacterium 13_2_20CM_2_66_6]|nr:MAG: hypothetical protein AUI15_41505 [Actinobacteria bacterium 13_2_20CM_2_66_6]